MVKELEAAGLAVVIITNGHHKVQRDKLEACNAYRLFHHIIVGGGEPSPRFPESGASAIKPKLQTDSVIVQAAMAR